MEAAGVTSGLKLMIRQCLLLQWHLTLALQSAIQGGTDSSCTYCSCRFYNSLEWFFCSSGYLLCDGTAVSRTTYAALFAVAGTGYGVGDGSSTFNLPDLRDRIPLGKGTNNSTLGTQTGSMSASSVTTTAADGDGDLTLTTTAVDALTSLVLKMYTTCLVTG